MFWDNDCGCGNNNITIRDNCCYDRNRYDRYENRYGLEENCGCRRRNRNRRCNICDVLRFRYRRNYNCCDRYEYEEADYIRF